MAEDYGLWKYNTTPEKFKAEMGEYLQNRGIDPNMEFIFDLNDDDKLNLTRITFTDGVTYGFGTWPPKHLSIGIYKSSPYQADSHNNQISSIWFAEGITEIGENELSGTINLKNIHLPNTLTTIADKAFYSDINQTPYTLEDLVIPDSVTSIGKNLFFGYDYHSSAPHYDLGPRNLVIGSGVTSIGNGAFEGCGRMESCEFKEGFSITKIPNYMFYGCGNLKEINLPESVTEIGNGAFYGCKSIEKMVISNDVKLKDRAFSNASIQDFKADAITSIGHSAFIGFSGMSLSFPSVVTVEYEAFMFSGIKSLEFGENLTSIGQRAISGRSDGSGGNNLYIEEIVIHALTPPTLASNAIGVGSQCRIFVPDEVVDAYKAAWVDMEELIYPLSQRGTEPPVLEPIGDKAVVTLADGEVVHIPAYSTTSTLNSEELPYKIASMVITENVVKIGANVGKFSSTLTSVTLSDSVKTIGSGAFSYCDNLRWENITWGGNVQVIQNDAFASCPKFENITLPESIVKISSNAFYNCNNLKTVTLGNLDNGGVTLVGNVLTRCSRLNTITIIGIAYIDSNYCFQESNNCTIRVLEAEKEFYQTNRYWRNFASRIKYYSE